MNYRHAYHAGGHADVLKHAVLALIILHLKQKVTPFRVLDSHGGIGVYDLTDDAAQRTAEWQLGVGRLYGRDGSSLPLPPEAEAALAPWREVVAAVNSPAGGLRFYPGSPQIARRCLRSGDRLSLNELHPEDQASLAAAYRDDRRVTVTSLDAATALKAGLPPPERRGVVMIDPSYEDRDAADAAIAMISEAYRRFTTGIFVLWYPVTGDRLAERLQRTGKALAIPKTLDLSLLVRRPVDGGGLAGSGLIIINPPWQFEAQMRVLLPALADRLRQSAGAGAQIRWLQREIAK